MGLTARIFLIEDGDRLRRIPYARFDRLLNRPRDADSFPEYAGQRIQYAMVILELENRKPSSISYIDCGFLLFDQSGQIDQDDWLSQKRLGVATVVVPAIDEKSGSLVDLSPHFARQQLKRLYRWELTSAIEAAINEAIFGPGRTPLRLI